MRLVMDTPSDGLPGAASRLDALVRRLREPGGCPWDREQTHDSLTPFVIEEAHEVVDAIHGGGAGELRDELGDLLLKVVLHARIAEEAGRLTMEHVTRGLSDKLVRRHPHVFGGAPAAHSAGEVNVRWEAIKADEKKKSGDATGALAGVPKGLPALLKAQRLTEKAGRTGFDWPD